MCTNKYEDEQINNRENDQECVEAKKEDGRQDEALEETKKEKATALVICIILMLAVISLIFITAYIIDVAKALHTKEQVLSEYGDSFYESSKVIDAMMEISWKYRNNEITLEQFRLYDESYDQIVSGIKFNQNPSEELLNEYNESIKDIFGDETKYLLEAKVDRDLQGFEDGMTFRILEYNVGHALKKGEISEEEYHKYQDYKDRVRDDMSPEEVKKLIMYMNNLVDVIYSINETI